MNNTDAASILSAHIIDLQRASTLDVLSIHELRSEDFAGCEMSNDDINKGLKELSEDGVITLYEHDCPAGLCDKLRASLLWIGERPFNAFIVRS